jgi:hypothetical protein
MLLCVYRYPYFKEGDCPYLRISCVAETGRRWPFFFAMAQYSSGCNLLSLITRQAKIISL